MDNSEERVDHTNDQEDSDGDISYGSLTASLRNVSSQLDVSCNTGDITADIRESDDEFRNTRNIMSGLSDTELSSVTATNHSGEDLMNYEFISQNKTLTSHQNETSEIIGHKTLQNCDINYDISNMSESSYSERHTVLMHEITDEEIFYDALGDDDLQYETNGDDCFESQYTNLFKLLDNANYGEPININLVVSKTEILLAILTYSKKFNLPKDAIVQLCKMINLFVGRDLIPSTPYLIDKYFYPKDGIDYHAICPTCKTYVGVFSHDQQRIFCNICETDVQLKSPQYRDYFALFDIKNEVKNLLEENSEFYTSVDLQRRVQNTLFTDIYDGVCYRNVYSSLLETEKSNFVTITFNTDGSPVFQSSKCSIWPIQVIVNEVPMIQRKNPITFGLWFGRDKPNMVLFLKPFVDYMNRYSRQGINCIINGEMRNIKVFALCCCVDSVARGPIQGLVQFNGFYGCNWCLQRGESIATGRGHALKYLIPNTDEDIKLRTEDEHLIHLQEALHLNYPIYGVKSATPLLNLNKFHLFNGLVVDYMHCIPLGDGKLKTELWFSSFGKQYSLHKQEIEMIDNFLNKLQVPSYFARLTRSLTDRKYWKAREWENWILFYSLPLLQRIVDSNNRFYPYFHHWQYLAEAFYILLKEEISIEDVHTADNHLKQYISHTEELYSQEAMTYNVHILNHLAQSVWNWGPLWAHSGYFFENGNGQILKNIHAAKGVISQICRQTRMKESILILDKRIRSIDNESPTLEFCNNLNNKCTQKSIKLNKCRYFGVPKIPHYINIHNNCLSEHAKAYRNMLVDNCLYQVYVKPLGKCNNTYAVTHTGQFIRLLEFVIDVESLSELTACNIVFTEDEFNVCTYIKKIVKIDNVVTTIETSDIKRICIYMKVDSKEYISAVPNMHNYS